MVEQILDSAADGNESGLGNSGWWWCFFSERVALGNFRVGGG